jgi:hypothetical protein
VVDYGKENWNRTTGRKFDVSEVFLRDWRTRILFHECLSDDSEARSRTFLWLKEE